MVIRSTHGRPPYGIRRVTLTLGARKLAEIWRKRRRPAYTAQAGPGPSSFRSVSDSPDDDRPLGKHIVWGVEAKPPVFGHWPTALLYGLAGKLKSGASDASQKMSRRPQKNRREARRARRELKRGSRDAQAFGEYIRRPC
jgi:hypothetical protein